VARVTVTTVGESTTARTYARFRLRRFFSRGWRVFAAVFTVGYAGLQAAVFLIDGLDPLRFPVVASIFGVALVAAIIAGLIAQARLRSVTVAVDAGHSVTVVVGDFMDNLDKYPRASFVLGINDRAAVEGLAEDSLHFAVLDRFSRGGARERQESLDDALLEQRLIPRRQRGRVEWDRRTVLPHGTVVMQPVGTFGSAGARSAFLVVNSSRGRTDYRGTGASRSAADQVWAFHEHAGVFTDEILFSLVGTGRSRDLSKMHSALRIIDRYFEGLAHDRPVRIARVVISILPSVVRSGEVDLDVLHRYMSAKVAAERTSATGASA